MALTKEDLRKIKAVVDAGAEMTKSYVDKRITDVESKMATKADLHATESRLTAKIDTVKEMHIEDHAAVMGDVEKLTKLPKRLAVFRRR